MTEWFDPHKNALAQLEDAENDLVFHLAKGPWGTVLMEKVVKYLGCLWQTENNDGRSPEETKGIKTTFERLSVLGKKAQPQTNREGDEDYGSD